MGGHLFTYWTPCLSPDQPQGSQTPMGWTLVSNQCLHLKCPQHMQTRKAGRSCSPVTHPPADFSRRGGRPPPGRGLLDFGGSKVPVT